jgi:hypothetical protein
MTSWPTGRQQPEEVSLQMIFHTRNSFISAVISLFAFILVCLPNHDGYLNFSRPEGQRETDSLQLKEHLIVTKSSLKAF